MRSSKMVNGLLATAMFACAATGAMAQADNTNSKIAPATFSGWMSDYSKANNGRISRDAYLKEAERRWDAMDKDRKGLTVEQINQAYGYGPPLDTRPGAMGSNNAKGN